MIIITRVLVAEEFGTWTLISGLLFYGIILDPVVGYWVTRETARNIPSQKTSKISFKSKIIALIFLIIIVYLVKYILFYHSAMVITKSQKI